MLHYNCNGWQTTRQYVAQQDSNSKLAFFQATEVASGRLKPQNPPTRVQF
jgi:hypothetical protein